MDGSARGTEECVGLGQRGEETRLNADMVPAKNAEERRPVPKALGEGDGDTGCVTGGIDDDASMVLVPSSDRPMSGRGVADGTVSATR